MSGDENLTPELARIIGRISDRLGALESRNIPIGAQSLNDLNDVYINVLSRADNDVVTWLEDEQYWTNLPGGGDPSAFDYLQANAATTGGIASGAIESLAWTVDAPNTVGTDISVVSNVVTINADGLYSVMTSHAAQAESSPDTYTRYVGLLDVEPNEVGRPSSLQTSAQYPASHANGHYGSSSFAWVGFLPAGAEFDVTMQMTGDAAVDWEVSFGWIQVHRIG